MMRVLERVAKEYDLAVEKNNRRVVSVAPKTSILFTLHSHLDFRALPGFTGSHLIRDPRDAIVSGYHYHLWTNESWAHEPKDEYNGLSYQQKLNSISKDDGLTLEIQRFQRYAKTFRLLDWNYDDERFFEIKYENLIENEAETFAKLFEHYGFSDAAIDRCVNLAAEVSFEKIAKQVTDDQGNSHLRSGKAGQWRDQLNHNHCQLIKQNLANLLIHMGYESDANWP